MNNMDHIFGISGLIAKHLTGALSADEQQSLDAWLKEDENHVEMFNRIVAHENLAAALIEMEQADTELALTNVKSRIAVENGKSRSIRLWPRIAAVAAAVAMVVFGVWFFNYRGEILRDALDDKSVVVNDIAPGKNGATITLGNGKVIQLSDAKSGVVIGEDKLAYNDNTAITTPPSAPLLGKEGTSAMTASTTKGQTYIFTLPDGTKVWLNAASTLTIPSDFSGTETRKVELTGEAYFEVAKNKKRAFIVESAGQEVRVLGTHFNISAYEDEGSIKTTLLEGSVRVATLSALGRDAEGREVKGNTNNSSLPTRGISPRGGESSIVLKPNQQSVVTDNNWINVKEIDAELAVAWKNNKFVFANQPIQDIMRMVARWYNVEVIYQGQVTDEKFRGSVSRFDNVSKVLKMLESTGSVHFKIEGRRIYVLQ